jgi:hypothetical protein
MPYMFAPTQSCHRPSNVAFSATPFVIAKFETQNSTLDICAIEAVPLEDLDTAAVQQGKTTAEQELAKATVSLFPVMMLAGKNVGSEWHRHIINA